MKSFLERLLLLKCSPLFGEVPTDDLRVVVEQLREEVCFAGERIFDIHDPCDEMYIVMSGKIGISLNEDPTITQFVGEIGSGECFGEMGLLDDMTRSATAHVVEDGILLCLARDKLRGLIISYPELAFGLLRSLSLRLRKANELIGVTSARTKGEIDGT